MADKIFTPRAVQSLDVFLNAMKVGTIVRTPGDFNAFNFDEAYRATGGSPTLSLSFRAAAGGLRKDPRPLPVCFQRSSPICYRRTSCARPWKGTMPAMFVRAMISTCWQRSVRICRARSASCPATASMKRLRPLPRKSPKRAFLWLACK